MATTVTLASLKNGLDGLKAQADVRRKDILARLASKQPVTASEEEWLDGAANFVDEDLLIGHLEKASNFDVALADVQADATKTQALHVLLKNGSTGGQKRNRTGSVSDTAESQDSPDLVYPTKPSKKPKKQDSKQVVGRRENPSLKQRIDILNWHHAQGDKAKQTKTIAHFKQQWPHLNISQPSLSAWLKSEPEWRGQWEKEQEKGNLGKAKRSGAPLHPQVNDMLELWVNNAMGNGLLLTGVVLREKWTFFADRLGIQEADRIQLSQGWLTSFKARCGLRQLKKHGEAASADPLAIEADQARIREVIESGKYGWKDIFNMDETGLFYSMPPDRGLMNRQLSGVKGNKTRITYALTTNADGSEKLPAFIIGKAAKPRCFNKKTGDALGFLYRNNAKAWMTAVLYQEWILDLDKKFRLENRHILLLQDNFSGHILPETELTNIKVINFAANLTAHVQPMDAGIIRCFKAHYRARYIRRSLDRYDAGVTASLIYDIDQLEAMHIAKEAWKDVDTTTIRNCWRKVNILPPSAFPSAQPPTPAASISVASLLAPTPDSRDPAIVLLDQELNRLEMTGIVTKANRCSIESLLNPEGENNLMPSATEEEIFLAVTEMKNCENESTPTEDDPYEPGPSRKEALAAVAVLQSYLRTLDLRDPRLESLSSLGPKLSLFGHQTRLEATQAMEDGDITKFFAPK